MRLHLYYLSMFLPIYPYLSISIFLHIYIYLYHHLYHHLYLRSNISIYVTFWWHHCWSGLDSESASWTCDSRKSLKNMRKGEKRWTSCDEKVFRCLLVPMRTAPRTGWAVLFLQAFFSVNKWFWPQNLTWKNAKETFPLWQFGLNPTGCQPSSSRVGELYCGLSGRTSCRLPLNLANYLGHQSMVGGFRVLDFRF